jgi:hypothetical protein
MLWTRASRKLALGSIHPRGRFAQPPFLSWRGRREKSLLDGGSVDFCLMPQTNWREVEQRRQAFGINWSMH